MTHCETKVAGCRPPTRVNELSGYVIDSSSLLQIDGLSASPRYPNYTDRERDLAWSRFEQLAQGGQLLTVPMVADELKRHSPTTHSKLVAIPNLLVRRITALTATVADIVAQFPDLVRDDLDYEPADPWLVALAVQHRFAVVTQEFPTSFRRKPGAPRIPDVCEAFELECIDVDEMLARLNFPSALERRY